MDIETFHFHLLIISVVFISFALCSPVNGNIDASNQEFDSSFEGNDSKNEVVIEKFGENKATSSDMFGKNNSNPDTKLWRACYIGDELFFNHARPCKDTTLCRCYNKKACCINITETIPKLDDNITELSCRDCFNRFLKQNAFSNISHLKLIHLDLGRLFLRKIDVTSFSKFKNLKSLEKLDLSTNTFTKIPQLCNNENDFSGLKWLDFHNNRLVWLNNGSFDCFRNLTHLYLWRNDIKNFDIHVFTNLTKLEVLDLHTNWITNQRVKVIDGELTKLKVLNLSYNEIGIWPPNLCNGSDGPFPNLETLNLAANLITFPWNETWSCLKHLKLLNLTRNPIRFIVENTFSELASLEKLFLNDIFFSIEVFKETALNNSNMWMLTLSNNKMDFRKKTFFRHIFEHSSNLTRLHLSGNNFRKIEDEIYNIVRPVKRTLKYLYMNGCNLTSIPTNLTSTLPKLRGLKMNQNQITGFISDDFKHASKLTYLSMANNKIHSFDPNALAEITRFNLRMLDLSSNPLDCSCDTRNENRLRESINVIGAQAYIGTAKLMNWPKKYRCDSPASREGLLLQDFDVDRFCPETNWTLIILLSFSSFVFVVVVISVIVNKYIWYIKYWMYKARKRMKANTNPERRRLLDDIDQTSKDVYIINHDNEDRFVLTDLRDILEQQMGYSSCIYHRDCCNGVKLELMIESMYKCRHTMAVVSRSFIKDPWCLFQLDVAYDRQLDVKNRNLLLLIYDDIDFQTLNKYWCVMLTKTPAARWVPEGNENYLIMNELFRQEIERQLGSPKNLRRD